ncbi:SBP domain [Dillenia turbinata]|uniref:SBP domain n=1 Tax=Dillenia turbinata TaxID=194707 RepID=A0AAN8UDS5_9MAGN
METKFRGKAHHFFGPVVSDLKAVGKKSLEWDLNDWKWDGDLFTATPLNPTPSDCRSRQLFPPVGSEIPANIGLSNSSSSCSEDMPLASDKGKRELEKRRRVVEQTAVNDEAGSLNLRLGGQVYPIIDGEVDKWEEKSGKKTKLLGSAPNRAVCQVEDCRVDLSDAKDYHRRHKVCDMHSKASKALVGNVMQRFCQQCSRFHVLQEFDEGKRSCRRRLAGHNRRRRKTHPETVISGGAVSDERGSSYLLISLLRILSNMHANNSGQTKDQDLLSHFLGNLANLAGTFSGRDLSALLQGSRELQNVGVSVANPGKVPNLLQKGPESASRRADCSDLQDPPVGQCVTMHAAVQQHKETSLDDGWPATLQTPPAFLSTTPLPISDGVPVKANVPDATLGRIKLNNFDLNNVYNESHDCVEISERCAYPVNPVPGSPSCPLWVQQDSLKSSPPQTSGNSDSTSTRSLSSSSGEAQSCTDRIVFKLFGKDPNDFPVVLRRQILDWLSHSPTNIESYIRPGCVILTIYLRLGKSTWEELCGDLNSSLSRLLSASSDSFWTTGWVYTRVRHRVAFIYNGQVVLDTLLPFQSHRNCKISSIKPIAVSVSERVQFVVKGFNILRTTRLLCALEGKYLYQDSCYDVMESTADSFFEQDELQTISFCCSIPHVSGRGFIEVEDHGLSSSFFPFIVAEEDVCSEICMLESAIEVAETAYNIVGEADKLEIKSRALDFIHEMGWLLHRCHLKSRLGNMDPSSDFFPFQRFKWLLEFSLEHDWCAVVKKLLAILFSGTVDAGDHSSLELALSELSLLHQAVRRNCRPMVEFLLRYVPDKVLDKPGSEQKQQPSGGSNYIFRPDAVGIGGLTPLHIAASTDGSENVLDALTDDPGMVGIEAWRKACDNTGLTPNDYACLRSHYSYIHLVQRKLARKLSGGHVVLDIPGNFNPKQKLADGLKSAKFRGLQIEKAETRSKCGQCLQREQKLAYGSNRTLIAYRPAMLSMVAIAAVCVCVALLFKSSPEVLYVFRPFRWDSLKYGPM